ncbi:MAG: transporter substrate-binding domain-containing protein [Pseudomonadota bacterium]
MGHAWPIPRALVWICALMIGAAALEAQHSPDRTLTGGWDEFPPYSYRTDSGGITRWEGFDVDLLREISKRAGFFVIAERQTWPDILKGIESGAFDIAPHATKTAEREAFAHFSIPYRSESTVLTVRRGRSMLRTTSDMTALIAMFRETGFRLGLRPGVTVQSAELREFIADPGYEGAITRLSTVEMLSALLDGDIDGFLSNRVLAAHYIETFDADALVREYPLMSHGDLHLMFSKATVPIEVVERYNEAIEAIYADGTFQRLNTRYSFPILVRLSIDSTWFRTVDIIGTIAFAISGLLLAVRYNYDVFGALVLASLPAVGGGVVRDIVSNRGELAVMSSPVYILLILVLVVGGFTALRLGRHLQDRLPGQRTPDQIAAHWRLVGHGVQLCDAIGLAAFTVTGVVVALITHAAPLWLWGPILAVITAAGGGILRDITRSDPDVPFLKGELYPEIAAFWGLMLSLYLTWEAQFLDAGDIRFGIVVTFVGALVTRLVTIRLGLKSPRFSA